MIRILVLGAVIACSKPAAMTTDQYVAAGVPDPGHVWTTADLETAATALSHLERERLPPHTSAIFAKLVAPAADDPSAPIEQRMQDRGARYETLNRASKLYAVSSREQLDLFAALLTEGVAISKLADPFLATFPPDDPKLPIRREGIAKMYSGYGAMLLGALLILDNRQLPIEVKRALLSNLIVTWPALYPKLVAEQQTTLRETLDKLAAAPSGPIHDELVRLRSTF